MADISVIICAYTEARWTLLAAAVASIERQSRPPRELIVVVDHNPALLARAQAAFPGHTVVENSGPQGLSGARNSGIKLAGGRIIAFMDEDAEAAPDWLERLAGPYEDPHVWGSGGAIIPRWQAGRPAWFPPEFDWVVGCTYRGLPQERQPVRNLIGCNMSFRRELFEQVGGFQSGIGRIGSLPVGCEETELCIRFQQHEPSALFSYEPAARVYHHVPADRGRWRYFQSRCYFEGRSKALVTSLWGSRSGLASERAYTYRTLPRGIWLALGDAVRKKEGGRLLRAPAIALGLAFTTAGYLWGLRERKRRVEMNGQGVKAWPVTLD